MASSTWERPGEGTSVSELLPLFPLRTVLFPGMHLPLHVFEPRYQALVRHCLDRSADFGIALIRTGDEVGGAAEPYAVGTSARIVDLTPHEDGRYDLLVRGERRFEIEAVLDDAEPYLVGRVRYLDDPPAAEADALEEAVAHAFADHLGLVAAVAGEEVPEAASWLLAATGGVPAGGVRSDYRIAAGLAVDPDERQHLLELDGADERLRAELLILERENLLLGDVLARRRASGEGPRLH